MIRFRRADFLHYVAVFTSILTTALLITETARAQQSVARRWNEQLLDAIRIDTPRPTVHSRNLFHTSAAMYDAWAAYDPTSIGYFAPDKVTSATDPESARSEAISYAAYRVLVDRFANSPGAAASLAAFDATMVDLGYDPAVTLTEGDSPAAVGNRIAATIIAKGMLDGSNQANNYTDTTGYVPTNPPLDVSHAGMTMSDPNRWQPLLIEGTLQRFLTPQWGDVQGFGIPADSGTGLRVDAGNPPQLGGAGDQAFRSAVVEIIELSSWLDPTDGAVLDISPGVIGNNPLGTNAGTGHDLNPSTGAAYASNVVLRGDYGRVLAEFWADGPHSETPPGHWNAILNDVSDNPLLEKRLGGIGAVVDDLEWDVKTYFALNAAVHDAAIVAWDNKEAYDYVRPISMVRYMGGLGQSTNSAFPSYHVDGLPLKDGLIELITSDSTAPGQRHEGLLGHEGEIAIRAWLGPPTDPTATGGVGWMLATEWLPYQAEAFITPPFPGYVSGHSTFSRAAAEVLTRVTGDSFFPGGLGEYHFDADAYLNFEDGPSQDVTLQWATYYDAADEAGLSRLYGGIHVQADDLNGRIVGSQVGLAAYDLATDYFVGVPEPVGSSLLSLALLLAWPAVRLHGKRSPIR